MALRTRCAHLLVPWRRQYEPHIVPSAFVRCVACAPFPASRSLQPARSDRLFCRITGRLVHMSEAAVLRHSEGKRFQTQLGALRLRHAERRLQGRKQNLNRCVPRLFPQSSSALAPG